MTKVNKLKVIESKLASSKIEVRDGKVKASDLDRAARVLAEESTSTAFGNWLARLPWLRKERSFADVLSRSNVGIPPSYMADLKMLPCLNIKERNPFLTTIADLPRHFILHDGVNVVLVDTQGYDYPRYAVKLENAEELIA